MNYFKRKRIAIMRLVEGVKGFVRTISGIPPITLSDCVDNDSIKNYSISGNSVQNGEPTLENPVEVESVGELTTKNVFNYRRYCEEWEAASPYGTGIYSSKPDVMYLNEDCFSIVAYSAGLKFMDSEFKENTQYTFKFSVAVYREGYTSSVFAPIYVYYTDDTRTTISRSMYPDRFIDIQFTTDANKTVKYILIPSYTPTARIYFKKTFQIEEGTTATEYEPYGKYKIPIKMSGKNLFNPEEIINKFESGDTYKVSEAYLCTSFQLKPNTTYYMKTFNPTGGSGRFFMASNENVNSSTSQTISVIDESSHTYPRRYEKSATTDDTGLMYIGYYYVGGAERNRILRENQIQIVEGSYTSATAPDYEPYVEPIITNIYLDEPLAEGQTITNPVKLPTTKGTTIYSIETKVQPSNVSAEYYSTSKGE